MSQVVLDIKKGIQDYIDTTTVSPGELQDTVNSSLRHLQQAKFVHAYKCVMFVDRLEVTVEPRDDVGKVYNLRFVVTNQGNDGSDPQTNNLKAYDRSMKGIG